MKKLNKRSKSNFISLTEKELNVYSEIYSLPILTYNYNVTSIFFKYCKTKGNFINAVLYDKTGKIYLKQSGINCFHLPGGSLKYNLSVRESIKSLVENIDKNIFINEAEPVAFIKNIYCNNNECFEHFGICVFIRVTFPKRKNIPTFTVTNELLKSMDFEADCKLIKMFVKRFKNLSNNHFDVQDNEITTNKRYYLRYSFHNFFVKKFILNDFLKKKKVVRKIVKSECQHSKNLLDVSCGDNSILFDFIDDIEARYMIANDISWSQIELVEPKNKVIFTNHNALTFPFKEKSFDFVYCSNTLHHMENKESIQLLIKSMLRVGKKVMIYEIEDTNIVGGFPYVLNKYWYRGFLKDAGETFLKFYEFKEIILSSVNKDTNVRFSSFRNVQGNYMIAILESKNKSN